MFTEQVENIDKLLDELEELARADLPSAQFFHMLVERLRLALSAQSSLLLLPLAGGDWLPIASSGTTPAPILEDVIDRLKKARGNIAHELHGSAAGTSWIASPVRPHNFERGCLLSCLPGELLQHTLAALVELQTAFAEVVAVRQQSELETFLDGSWEQTQSLCLQLHATRSAAEAASLLANELARVLEAARVSVIAARGMTRPRVQAVSGVPQLQPRSHTLQALQSLAEEVIRQGGPVLRQQPYLRDGGGQPLPEIESHGCFANLIAVCLSPGENQAERAGRPGHSLSNPPRPITLLVIEYQTYGDMVRCATKLPHLLPTVAMTWEHHLRWLRLPQAARMFASRAGFGLRSATPLVRWVVVLALFFVIGWCLQRPTSLRIEAEGAYEPVTSRAIFASDDGFIDQLLVDDGTPVKAGQPLVQLRSPALELRIEQTQGEARAVEEEASGIRIAINQLSAESADFLSQQSRLAGKIAELETRSKSLHEQLQLLRQQRDRLLLLAPIQGRVVAKDLRRNLAGRPVRRGEALFSVVDQTGPWQVRLQVADRDVGYLLKHYAPHSQTQSPAADSDPPALSPQSPPPHSVIDFCLASDPDRRYQAQLSWIADHVENRHGEGCSLEVRGTVDPRAELAAHAGAGVHAFFECGKQPLWFVWCRPLVEAAQRRWWLRGQEQESE